MSTRTRIFLGILLLYIAGVAFFLYSAVTDIDPRYRESAEESQVENAQLLAALIEQDIDPASGAIDTARLDTLMRAALARRFSAQVYNLHKTQVELRVYVTDAQGRVLYDSTGDRTGADYAQYRDVRLTLAGEYGARTTRDDPDDPMSAVMYVGAPIRWNDHIAGAVTIGKPVRSYGQLIVDARARTLWVGIGSASALLAFTLIFSVWLVRPSGLVSGYIAWLRAQPRLSLARMVGAALEQLRQAVHEMRDAFTGHNYVADYVQTFTHEIKSPLSAIRGATELMQEAAMPRAQREHFLANIAHETQRIQEIVDRMMELTMLQTRRTLGRTERVALRPLLEEVASSARSAAAARNIRVQVQIEADAATEGDPFLLRRAVSNLLDNAIDFSPADGAVELALHASARHAAISVRDHGPGIPEYAREKVFQKFYSLARPHSQKKSTGLGLAFVQEIAKLHHGHAALVNAPEGGALATLILRRVE